MSWLRKQSIETFKMLNPSWEIEIIDGTGIEIEGESRLARVGRSDWARYRALKERGGVYFDTDIVFCKPIPDSWLEKGMILPFSEVDVFGHVAVIGCEAGNGWATMMDTACSVVTSGREALGYQTLGIVLANACALATRDYKVEWMDPSLFIPVAFNKVDHLWVSGTTLSPLTMGVHWFGGDWTSLDMEPKVDSAWMETSKCLIAKAWKKAMRTQVPA